MTNETNSPRSDICPACNQFTVEGQSFSVEGNCAVQEMYCLNCPATWTDVYKLVEQADIKLDD